MNCLSGSRLLVGRIALLLSAAACSGDGSAPALVEGDVVRVEVMPGFVDLAIGATRQLSAAAYNSSGDVLGGKSFVWSTSEADVATVSLEGLVTVHAAGTAKIRASVDGKTGEAVVTGTPTAPTGQVIEVSPSVTYQTMYGWEGVTQIGQVECPATAFATYKGPLIDRIVNELGINRVRLEIQSGMENPTDYWTQHFITHTVDDNGWRAHRYEIVNDNADPFVLNLAGIKFSSLDNSVDNVVTPMRQRLAARGERLYVNLNYVDFEGSAFEHSSDPDEYAELMLAIFQHLQSKYGWVPDAIEISLEPDNTENWGPTAIGNAIVATGDRLKSAGFSPDFIAPSTTNASRAIQYFDAMVQIPRVTEYLTELAYHRYSGVSPQVIQTLGSRAAAAGIRAGMLELVGATYEDLHEDLTLGRNSSWQQFSLAYCNPDDAGGKYYGVNTESPANPVVSMMSRARFLRQYFLFVRLGAVRIAALSGDGRFNPVAFRNPNGKIVVVVKAADGGNFEIRRLPAGTYGRKYTTFQQYNIDLADVTVGASGSLSANIPATGVITIYQR